MPTDSSEQFVLLNHLADSGRLLRVLPEGWIAAFSPDGKWLATGNSTTEVQVWDLAADPDAPPVPKFARRLGGDVVEGFGLGFSPDGRRLACGIRRGRMESEVRVLNLSDGSEALTLQSNTGPLRGVQHSPDGRYIAADLAGIGSAGLIRLWDAATGQMVQSFVGHRGDVAGMAFDPTGERLASAGTDGTVRVWTVPQGQETRLYRGHRAVVQAVGFSPDGMRLASASTDGTVKVWDLTLNPETAEVLTLNPEIAEATENLPLAELEALAFVGNEQLLTARRGGLIRTLDCDTHAQVGAIRQVALNSKWLTPAEPASLGPDGRWLAGIAADDARVARCWDARTGAERSTLRGHTQDLWLVTVSGNGRVATAGRPGQNEALRSEVKVWDGSSGGLLLDLDVPNFLVGRLALSPQGDRLAVTGVQPTSAESGRRFEAALRIYAVATGRIDRSYSGGDDPLLALAFSPDGTHVAAAGANLRTVLLWDLAAERPSVTRQGPEQAMDLAFSPDGRRLAVASRRMIKLLDAASGEEVLILRGVVHLNPDTNGFNPRVRFSPDGRRIAAVCHDYRAPVSIWSVEESGSDPAVRRLAADRRALAIHLDEAKSSLRDPKRQATFHLHLKWLERTELTSAADLAARGALFARDGRLDQATADFTRATELAPDDAAVWYACGAGLAAGGRWDQALPYFARFADSGRGNDVQWRSMLQWRSTLKWRCIPTLSLYLNDIETYRRRCQTMLGLYGRSEDPVIVSDLLSFGLLVGDSGVDPKVSLELADRCLAGNEKHADYRLMVRAKGMAEYRAGRMDQAIDWLRKAETLLKGGAAGDEVINYFFLSMAYQRLNRAEEAKATCQQGIQHMEKLFGGLDKYQPGKGEWHFWPWCQVIRREAEGLIEGNKAEPK